MRRADRAMSIDDAERLLQTCEYGILSMASQNGAPYGVPLNYVFDKNAIFFHCASDGKKIQLIQGNKQVSFCVVGETEVLPDKFGTKYESVVANGTAEEVFADEKRRGLVKLIEKYSVDHIPAGLEYIDKLIDQTRVFKISLDLIAGKARR